MKTILLTRPEQNGSASIARLKALGHVAINCPMTITDPLDFNTNTNEVNLIITSQNGAEYGLKEIANKRIHIFAVGEQTAEKAKTLGFNNITVGDSNGEALAHTIAAHYQNSTDKLPYVHLSGSELAFDIIAHLKNAGIQSERRVTYKTVPIKRLDQHVMALLENHEIDTVLFYSVQGATIFEKMMHRYNQIDLLNHMTAVSLSKRIDDQLNADWKIRKIADAPNEDSLFATLR
jgi:uroporphyrinogen-III synthase